MGKLGLAQLARLARTAVLAGCAAVLASACERPCDCPKDERAKAAAADPSPREEVAYAGRVELWYEARGAGPALVLLHGGGLDRRTWEDVAAELARSYRVLNCDLPGFGRSPAPSAPFAHDDVFLALLRAEGLESAHFVGLSYGASLAVDFALAHPDRVASLTLVSPGISGYPWSRATVDRFQRVADLARSEGSQAAVDAWMQSPGLAPAVEDDDLARRLRDIYLTNASTWLQPLPAQQPNSPAHGRLEHVTPPVLVIVGERDDPDVLSAADYIRQHAPHARKVELPTGHLPPLEDPDAFLLVLTAFLDDLPVRTSQPARARAGR